MKTDKVDLHVHTNISNGSEDLIYVLTDAQKNGVGVLSITDFNTMQAYFELENMDVKKYYRGSIVSGTEVNCSFNNYCADILAYNIKDKDTLEAWLKENTGRDNTKQAQIEQLEHYKRVARQLKARFDEEIQVTEEQPYAGRTIAHNLAKYSENYGKIKGVDRPMDFWVEHASNIESPFYFDISKYRPKLSDFKDIVHRCGGLVFAAHPFAYAHSEEKLQEYLEICKQEGIDGIECYQCYNEDIAYATEMPIEFCKRNGLYITGGTDFHKRTGDSRYSGVGVLGSDTVKNYSKYIPIDMVAEWIEPIMLPNIEEERE